MALGCHSAICERSLEVTINLVDWKKKLKRSLVSHLVSVGFRSNKLRDWVHLHHSPTATTFPPPWGVVELLYENVGNTRREIERPMWSRLELPFTPIRYYLNYQPLFRKLAHASGRTRNPDENWAPKRKFRRTYLFLFLRVRDPNRFFDSYMYKIVEFPPENAKRYQNPWFLPLSKTART